MEKKQLSDSETPRYDIVNTIKEISELHSFFGAPKHIQVEDAKSKSHVKKYDLKGKKTTPSKPSQGKNRGAKHKGSHRNLTLMTNIDKS